LSRAGLPADSVQQYTPLFVALKCDANEIAEMKTSSLMANGVAEADAMRIKKFASECETMEDEFNRLFDVDASEPDPFGDDSAETTTTGSNSSHVQSSNKKKRSAPAYEDESSLAFDLGRSFQTALGDFMTDDSTNMLQLDTTTAPDGTTSGTAGTSPETSAPPSFIKSEPLSPGASPCADEPSVVVESQPHDPIYSGRSSQSFVLATSCVRRVLRVDVNLEAENGERVADGVVVEQTTIAPRDAAGACKVQLRLRLKSQRLQIRRCAFSLTVQRIDGDAASDTVTIKCRSAAFIVCSHITSQRDAAETRLRDALKRSTLGTLTEQISQKYALFGFSRSLHPNDIEFLRAVAMRAAHETGPAHDALVIDTSRFWKWFDKAMKQCKRLQSYWDRGAICGFISRVDAEEALASCADGTCIVRLSESVPKAFAVTVLSAGQISNKMIDKSASGDWELFVSSLKTFSGNIANVVTARGAVLAIDVAFPPQPRITSADDGLRSEEGGYDETATVKELVSSLRIDH